MGLDLTPRDYLHMLREEYREYQEYWHTHGYRVSIRKAINCCGHSNALPEIITAHRNPADPPEALDKKVALYREELRQRQPSIDHRFGRGNPLASGLRSPRLCRVGRLD